MAAAAVATVNPSIVKSKPTPSSALLTDQAQDIPIFLRKTYHMIDTCDPTIACWSEDGETFVVKDPNKFEQQIIPQFFKHSKFSSFVRQLNFYAFRKIKYADTIRIDPKLEAETANYWRFRHEKFQRGKPELLGEIKRMNGQKQQQAKEKTTSQATSMNTEKENSALKSEVSNLKQRIEAMTKNIDDLTTMVQKVTLGANPNATQRAQETVNANNKRTKTVAESEHIKVKPSVAVSPMVPDQTMSAPSPPEIASMDLDDLMPPSIPSPIPTHREESTNNQDLSDEGFVDQLFTAFKTEDFDFDETEDLPSQGVSNRPRPELMDRLSDALSNLPRDIQELIVDRLIQSITAPKEIQDNIKASNCLKETTMVAGTGGGKALPSAVVSPTPATVEEKPLALPLAAATLAALLSQYGESKPSSAAKSLAAANKDHKMLVSALA